VGTLHAVYDPVVSRSAEARPTRDNLIIRNIAAISPRTALFAAQFACTDQAAAGPQARGSHRFTGNL
jgi:hypothetical protein